MHMGKAIIVVCVFSLLWLALMTRLPRRISFGRLRRDTRRMADKQRRHFRWRSRI
jgi:hypothetical protein